MWAFRVPRVQDTVGRQTVVSTTHLGEQVSAAGATFHAHGNEDSELNDFRQGAPRR